LNKLRRRASVHCQRHAHRQQTIDPESGIDSRECLQRAHGQAGAGEQDDGERGLEHHQRAAKPMRAG
jgi:hypothetical protein